MAGYFHYLGKVFTEKGSWYKILLITALQGIAVLFNPQENFKAVALGPVDFNIPGVILYLLCSALVCGYCLQIYSASMNNKQKLLPDIDFADMFIRVIRFIPFILVWLLYWSVIGVFFGFTFAASSKSIMIYPLAIIGIVFLVALFLAFPVVMVLHAKNFSYKHVLNPLTPFRIVPKVGGPVALLALQVGLLYILLAGILILFGMIVGVSANPENAGSEAFVFAVLVGMYLYVYNAFSFAYNHKLCDIVKSKLDETEYLDDDFDTSNEEVPEDDEDAFAGYMHNKDEDLDL